MWGFLGCARVVSPLWGWGLMGVDPSALPWAGVLGPFGAGGDGCSSAKGEVGSGWGVVGFGALSVFAALLRNRHSARLWGD